ncbi:MAG: DUF3501 family protein [Acidimicrobiales bacterium]
MTRSLTIDDISDLRAYERERDAFRSHVIAVKRRRRIALGPFVTLLFENRDTIRFQIQEMARVEKLISDEAIEGELRAYNPLIPEPGHLSATLFIELTSEELLREWLPKLVGIERSILIDAGDGSAPIRCEVDPAHESQLTRDDITASVHYVNWSFSPEQVEAFANGAPRVLCDHPEYGHVTDFTTENQAELLADLRS